MKPDSPPAKSPSRPQNMHEYRKKLGLRQAVLVERIGCRRKTIGKPENGKYNPSPKLAMDIAKVFGATVEEVFFED